jgi:ABC-type branched-subunit amino acid transport system substrate-binding protein
MARLTAASTPTRGAALLACALALGGCLGGDDDEPPRIKGDTATIYSSTPRHGVSARDARAVLAGERRALAERGGRAGGLRIRLRRLVSTEDAEHPWDPDLVSANAHRAADDPTAIAYLGELDYGATAVSLPITNEVDLLQVSPADGLTSLTQRPPGRPRAGPERYYPSEKRTFARVTSTDLLEAERLLARASSAGADRIGIVFDRDIYGRELAGQVVARARRQGLEPVASEQYDGRPDSIPDLARTLAEARPNAVVHAGVAGPGTARLLAAIDRQLPGVPVYATSGILVRDMPIPAAPGHVEAVGPAASPRRAGYEAMRLALDAIDAGGRDRRLVIGAALRLARRLDTDRLVLYRLSAGKFSPR